MKTLNKISARILCDFIDKMNNNSCLKIASMRDSTMCLHIEHSGSLIETPKGNGDGYYLMMYCQTSGAQSKESEIDLIVVDTRKNRKGNKSVFIYPYKFSQQGYSISDYSKTEGTKPEPVKFHKPPQADICYVANRWFKSIKKLGF